MPFVADQNWALSPGRPTCDGQWRKSSDYRPDAVADCAAFAEHAVVQLISGAPTGNCRMRFCVDVRAEKLGSARGRSRRGPPPAAIAGVG